MTELLVLGLGSPFADDQLGWEVVKVLEQKKSLGSCNSERLQLKYYDRPGPHLLELMHQAHNIFLIDAVKAGAPIGSCLYFQADTLKSLNSNLSSHSFGLSQTLALGEALDDLPKNLVFYGIEIGEPRVEFALSSPIRDAIKEIAQQIEKDILNLLKAI